MRTLRIKKESWKLAQEFKISRGSKTHADVVVIEIQEKGNIGWSECVPYPRYGESFESVIDSIENFRIQIENGAGVLEIAKLMKPGAARNSVDCALWDLEAKIQKKSVSKLLGLKPKQSVNTAQTISVDQPEIMAKEALKFRSYPLLKVKLGNQNVIDSIKAIHFKAPNSEIIIDANEAWSIDGLNRYSKQLKQFPIGLIEQPLPSNNDEHFVL